LGDSLLDKGHCHADVGQGMRRGWIFGDPIIATAILDWLPHRAATNCIQGERYPRKRRRRAGLKPGRDEGGAVGGRVSCGPRLRCAQDARFRAVQASASYGSTEDGF
jgi:hypothetical protein